LTIELNELRTLDADAGTAVTPSPIAYQLVCYKNEEKKLLAFMSAKKRERKRGRPNERNGLFHI